MASLKQLVLNDLQKTLAKEKTQPSLKPFQRAQVMAAVNWLYRYIPEQPSENLDQVRGNLEAFHHLCNISDWTNAHRIAFAQAEDLGAEELHEQLFNWGHYREQQQIYERLLYRLDCQVDLICLNGLGSLHDVLGNVFQSLDYHQQSLELARKLGNAEAEATALGNLGNAYLSLRQPQRSLDFYHQHLEKARAVGNIRSVGVALGNLGNVYRILEDYDRAIAHIQQRLEIAQTLQDRRGEGDAYGNLGSVYVLQGRLAEALALQQKAIAIAHDIGNRLGEGRAYGNMALVYLALGDEAKAVECFQSALHIARTIEDRESEHIAILQLGALCQQLNRYKDAIGYQQQALDFVSDPVRAGSLMLNLGTAYREIGNRVEAIAWYEKLITMASGMSEDVSERSSFLMMGHYCLAFTYWQMGQWMKAIAACDEVLISTDPMMAPLMQKIEGLRQQVLLDFKSAGAKN